MKHANTASPWWKRILKFNPVEVQAVARAVLVLAAGFGITVGDDLNTQIMVIIAAFYALVETVGVLIAKKSVTADAKVLERVNSQGQVVAGKANDMLGSGAIVRNYGE